MIDWSYRLLTEPEQVMLARLAVFQAGTSLDAIEAVCVGDPIESFDVIELVGSLVDKSLLNVDDTLPISARFRLPETIRQFATDRLLDGSELTTLRDRHAAWFGSLAVPLAFGPWQRSRTERGALARADQENLHRALEWATANGSADALRVIAILSMLHPELRPPDHLEARIRAALDATPDAPASLRAMALARLAWEIIVTGHGGDDTLAAAIDVSEQALASVGRAAIPARWPRSRCGSASSRTTPHSGSRPSRPPTPPATRRSRPTSGSIRCVSATSTRATRCSARPKASSSCTTSTSSRPRSP